MRARHLATIGLAATALAIGIAPAATARPAQQPSGDHSAAQPLNTCPSNNSGAGTYVNSQKFAAPSAVFTDTAAADFTVPAGGCLISGMDTTGQYSGPSIATKVNILIKGGATHPTGSNLASPADMNITNIDANSFGSFKVTLPAPVTLPAGHYWVIFQVKIAAGTTWGWQTAAVASGQPDVWRNPGNGWSCGTNWTAINAGCLALPQSDFGYIFW